MRPHLRSTVIITALLLLPSLALADAAAARRLFLEGKTHYGNRSYVEALHSFQAALKLVQRSSVVIMVARAYRNLDQPDRALEHYKKYQETWRTENPTAPSPHRGEVKNQVSRLQTVVDLVRRAEGLLETQPAAALALLETAGGMSPWPRVYHLMARCHLKLKQPRKAQAPLKAALGHWERYRLGWTGRHPRSDPPDHAAVQRRMTELKELERRVQTALADRTPAPTSKPADRGSTHKQNKIHGDPHGPSPQRSKLWLGIGIGAAALAVTSEVLAWVAYSNATDYHEHEPGYSTNRDLSIAGHVAAGTMAAAAAVSFYLYYRGGKPARAASAGVLVAPGPHGWWLVGRMQF